MNTSERRSQIVFLAGIGLCILGVLMILMARSEREENRAAAVATPSQPEPSAAPPAPMVVEQPVTPTNAPVSNGADRYYDQMRGSLRVLMTSEEVLFADAMSYTDDLSKLPGYDVPFGVTVRVMNVSQTGYQAVATHSGLRGESCAVFIGGAQPVSPARQMGKITCSNEQ